MSNIDFTAYIRLEQLPDEVKKRHGGLLQATEKPTE